MSLPVFASLEEEAEWHFKRALELGFDFSSIDANTRVFVFRSTPKSTAHCLSLMSDLKKALKAALGSEIDFALVWLGKDDELEGFSDEKLHSLGLARVSAKLRELVDKDD